MYQESDQNISVQYDGYEVKGNIEKSMKEMNEALDSEDYSYIKDMLDHLKEASYKFAEVIYTKQEAISETRGDNE